MNGQKIRQGVVWSAILVMGLGVWFLRPTTSQPLSPPVSPTAVVTGLQAPHLQSTDQVRLPQAAAQTPNPDLRRSLRWREEPSQTVGEVVRRRWLLRWQGLAVLPVRERVETYSRRTGELLARSGEFGEDLTIRSPEGDFTLTEADAQKRVRDYLLAPNSGMERRTAAVEKILWSEDRQAGAASRWAYRVWAQGRETIVDGASGTILQSADRRVLN